MDKEIKEKQDKKPGILYVLYVLLKYSDERHPLTQQDIIDHIENEFNIKLERKNIGSSCKLINKLSDKLGYEIVNSERNGSYIIGRKFEEYQVKYLVDALYSSKNLKKDQVEDIIDRILSTQSYNTARKYQRMYKSEVTRLGSDNFFNNIDYINTAIQNKFQISFKYMMYNNEGKLVQRKKDFIYTVSPYYLVNNFGKYYLLCKNEYYKDKKEPTIFRVDYMDSICILDNTAVTPPHEALPRNFNIDEYINNNIYIFTSNIVTAKILLEESSAATSVIDWYPNAKFKTIGDKSYALVTTNKQALVYWAMQYIDEVKVVEPLDVVEEIVNKLKNGIRGYEKLGIKFAPHNYKIDQKLTEFIRYTIQNDNNLYTYSERELINAYNKIVEKEMGEYEVVQTDEAYAVKNSMYTYRFDIYIVNNNEEARNLVLKNYSNSTYVLVLIKNSDKTKPDKLDGRFCQYKPLANNNIGQWFAYTIIKVEKTK